MAEYFYLQDSRGYVGNDILWWRLGGGYTTNLLEAEVFTEERAFQLHESRNSDKPWPKKYIDSKVRLSVDVQYTKTSEAFKGRNKKPIKPKKKRASSGKTRFNCPVCGKIHWQYNPYDFEGCDDISCEGSRRIVRENVNEYIW